MRRPAVDEFSFEQDNPRPGPTSAPGPPPLNLTPNPLPPPRPRRRVWPIVLIVALVLLLGAGLLTGLAVLLAGGESWSSGPAIGIVDIHGVILDSEETLKNIIRYTRNKDVKAVILRIDSPGGGVAATQEIYQELLRLRKEKKIVAALGAVAASGGLYVAAAADKVVANPATVTGSIGVIMQSLNLEDLMHKVGVKSVVIKSGQYKDIGSATRPMKDEERALLEGVVKEMHRQFVHDVAKGRKLPEDKVAAQADGRIFTGQQALALGLVDKLGNFQDALALAKNLAGLQGDVRLILPRKKDSLLRELLDGRTSLRLTPDWLKSPFSFQYLYLPGA